MGGASARNVFPSITWILGTYQPTRVVSCLKQWQINIFNGPIGQEFWKRPPTPQNTPRREASPKGPSPRFTSDYQLVVITDFAMITYSPCILLSNTDGNPLLNSIWLGKSGSAFNFMHSGYGVGAALAPGLLGPFTYEETKELANGTATPDKIISLPKPYSIVAGLCCVCACFFCCFDFCKSSKGVSLYFSITKLIWL